MIEQYLYLEENKKSNSIKVVYKLKWCLLQLAWDGLVVNESSVGVLIFRARTYSLIRLKIYVRNGSNLYIFKTI